MVLPVCGYADERTRLASIRLPRGFRSPGTRAGAWWDLQNAETKRLPNTWRNECDQVHNPLITRHWAEALRQQNAL